MGYLLMKLKKNDILLALGILFAALAILLFYLFMPGKEGTTAIVTVDGREEARFPLGTDSDYTIKTKKGTNHLEIREGSASITDADCPDKLCVHQHSIHKKGETLVCLPHKVIISISSDTDAEIDGIAQ